MSKFQEYLEAMRHRTPEEQEAEEDAYNEFYAPFRSIEKFFKDHEDSWKNSYSQMGTQYGESLVEHTLKAILKSAGQSLTKAYGAKEAKMAMDNIMKSLR